MRAKKSLPDGEPRFHQPDTFELGTSLLQQIHRKAVEGNSSVLIDLGLGVELIHAIRCLTPHELNHVDSLSACFLSTEIRCGQLNVRLDANRLATTIAYVSREINNEQLQHEMIRRMAPWPLMHRLFGMSKAEFVARRKSLGLAGANTGGCLGLADAQQEAVWVCWHRYATLAPGERCLQVARELGLTLNRLWPVIKPEEWWNCALTRNKVVNGQLIVHQPVRGHSPRERERRMKVVA